MNQTYKQFRHGQMVSNSSCQKSYSMAKLAFRRSKHYEGGLCIMQVNLLFSTPNSQQQQSERLPFSLESCCLQPRNSWQQQFERVAISKASYGLQLQHNWQKQSERVTIFMKSYRLQQCSNNRRQNVPGRPD